MTFDFSSYADGKTLCTSFLQQAIDAVPAGGTLLVPAGTYLTGSLFLKSNMTLELAKDAVILGVTDDSAYPPLPSRVAGIELARRPHQRPELRKSDHLRRRHHRRPGGILVVQILGTPGGEPSGRND